MKSIIALLLISFALLSCVEGAFVFDRRLLNTTRGRRDFTGSIRYGSFSYLGACPLGPESGLSYIKLSKVGSGSASCFTNAISGSGPTIGYICQPNSGTGIIRFGYPGSDGFVIGGAYFGGSASSETISGGTTFVWGGVGAPSYSGQVTGSCSTGCSANYCSSSCSASCVASTSATSGSVSCSTNTGTGQGSLYFVPSGTNTGFSNCGSLGQCCSSGNLFSYCQSESLITGTYATTYSAGPTAPQANAEYGISFIPSTSGIIAGVTYNAGSTTITQRLVKIWKNGVQATQFNSASGSGFLRTMLGTAVSVSSGDNIMVSFPVKTNDPSSPYSSFTPGSTITNNRFLTSSGPFYSLTSGAIPNIPHNELAALDIIFNPCT